MVKYSFFIIVILLPFCGACDQVDESRYHQPKKVFYNKLQNEVLEKESPVCTAESGTDFGLALSDTEAPLICYQADQQLKFFTKGSKSNVEAVPFVGGVGQSLAFAQSPGGAMAVVFFGLRDRKIRCATKVDGKWIIETVESVMPVKYGPLGLTETGVSAVFDSSGTLFVSYIDLREGIVRLLWKNASGWHAEDLTSPTTLLNNCVASAVDSRDRLYISFVAERVVYVGQFSPKWEYRQVSKVGAGGGWPSLAACDDGHLALAYNSGKPRYEILCSIFDGKEWTTSVVSQASEACHGKASVAFNNEGVVSIVYSAFIEGAMKSRVSLATRNSEDWDNLVLNETASYAYIGKPSIAMSAKGSRYIVFGISNEDSKYTMDLFLTKRDRAAPTDEP